MPPGNPWDRIEVRSLRLLGTHGVLPEEQERPQPFEVDIDLYLDLQEAGHDDDLGATVDYAGLCEVARSVVEGPHAALVEHLAHQIAQQALVLAGERAEGVTVSVRKLRPPVPFQLASAGARVHRLPAGHHPDRPADRGQAGSGRGHRQ